MIAILTVVTQPEAQRKALRTEIWITETLRLVVSQIEVVIPSFATYTSFNVPSIGVRVSAPFPSPTRRTAICELFIQVFAFVHCKIPVVQFCTQ